MKANANLVKVGMREFREHMQQYMHNSAPVAITRHGQTVGFYIPANRPQQSDIDHLKRAAEQLDNLLSRHSVTEDDLLADFRALRDKKDS